MNRAIDSATAEKRRICRVHNGINVEFRDVAADDLDLAIQDSSWIIVIYNDECE